MADEKTTLGTAHKAEEPTVKEDPAHTTPDTRTEDEVQGGFESAGRPIPAEDRPPTLGKGLDETDPTDSTKGASNPDGKPSEPPRKREDKEERERPISQPDNPATVKPGDAG
jgi:hypothetical protein